MKGIYGLKKSGEEVIKKLIIHEINKKKQIDEDIVGDISTENKDGMDLFIKQAR